MIVALCIPCRHGLHDQHQPTPRASIPGLIGSGHTCPCTGDCVNTADSLVSDAIVRALNPPEPLVWEGDYA